MARLKLTTMRYTPPGYGGTRRSPEDVKRHGWQDMGLLAVSVEDPRLSWPEREMVAQLGRKLYGPRGGGRQDG